MKLKTCKVRTLAVMLAVFSSVAAMGQQKKDGEINWLKDFTSRITLTGVFHTVSCDTVRLCGISTYF